MAFLFQELGMPRPTQEPMTRKTNKQRDDPADRRPGHYQRRGSEDRRRKEEELQRERERQQEKLRRLSNQTQIADGECKHLYSFCLTHWMEIPWDLFLRFKPTITPIWMAWHWTGDYLVVIIWTHDELV